MSVLTPREHSLLTTKLMKELQDLINTYLIEAGITKIPTVQIREVECTEIALREIVDVVNSTIDKTKYPSGLSTRSRNRELVQKRQVVSYICKYLGFHLNHIGKSMYITHATVLHGVYTVANMLKTKEPLMIAEYNYLVTLLNEYHKEKYGKDLPKIITGGLNS